MAGKKAFDGDATAEHITIDRIAPPMHEANDIAVAAPPELTRTPSSQLLRFVPIVTAVVTVGAMCAAYYARSSVVRNPAFMMFPLMMLISAVATALLGSNTRRGEIDVQRADYLDYLSETRASVLQNAAAQYCSTAWRHPDPDALWTLVGGRRMWERAAEDPDFCHLRIGVGDLPLATRLVAPTIESVNRLDPVGVAALRRFLGVHSTVANAPIAILLRGKSTVSIRGDGEQVRALVRAMLCQLAVLHSPATVLIAASVSDSSRPYWEWLKWLPHNRHPFAHDDIGPTRMVYASAPEALGGLMSDDRFSDAGSPRVVVVADSDDQRHWVAAEGVTVLKLECGNGKPVVVTAANEEVAAHTDQLSYSAALVCAQRLAGYRPSALSATTGMSWQNLLGINDIAAQLPVAYRSIRGPGSRFVFRSARTSLVHQSIWTSRRPPRTGWGRTGSASAQRAPENRNSFAR